MSADCDSDSDVLVWDPAGPNITLADVLAPWDWQALISGPEMEAGAPRRPTYAPWNWQWMCDNTDTPAPEAPPAETPPPAQAPPSP